MSTPSSSSPSAPPEASWLQQLRHVLASPPPHRLPPGEGKVAAVLVPLYVDAGELWTLLTRRADDLPTHKSQIAFPGGNSQPGEDSWDTALREAEEEIGLPPVTALRLGTLDEGKTPSGFRIVPCVAAIPKEFRARLQSREIAEVFPVPLSAFANPRLVEDREVVLDGQTRELRVYHVGSRQIWGLTARVLQNLLQRIGLESAQG
ncbi:MAG: CoA pyrophosphatase [Acidobacteriota bacterium]